MAAKRKARSRSAYAREARGPRLTLELEVSEAELLLSFAKRMNASLNAAARALIRVGLAAAREPGSELLSGTLIPRVFWTSEKEWTSLQAVGRRWGVSTEAVLRLILLEVLSKVAGMDREASAGGDASPAVN